MLSTNPKINFFADLLDFSLEWLEGRTSDAEQTCRTKLDWLNWRSVEEAIRTIRSQSPSHPK
jgi:hypothetical protein